MKFVRWLKALFMRFDAILTSSCENTTTSTTTTTTTTCALPSAPSGVSSEIHMNAVSLTWTLGNGNLSQQIWRSINGEDYALLDTVSAATTLLDDDLNGYPTGTIACYKVRGQNACGFSAFSDSVCEVVE